MIAVIRAFLIRIGGYIVAPPLRFVRRVAARTASASGLDTTDLQAIIAVTIYLTLGTLVVAWAASMFVLVRWIVGV